MPSHLSSTPTNKLAKSNVQYSGFDVVNVSNQDDGFKCAVNTPDGAADNITKICCFVRNTIHLPPDIAFQVLES